MRNVLLAMMQGEKPRYEIRIIYNPSGSDQYDDLDVKLLKYKMLPPPPPPKQPPPQGDTYTEPKMKAPPPPPKGAPASSSSSGAQFGFATAPKPPPPMNVKGAVSTRTKPLGEIIGTTWSGCYGELLSDSSD
eukprot:3596510-Amphidinium_carterae.1